MAAKRTLSPDRLTPVIRPAVLLLVLLTLAGCAQRSSAGDDDYQRVTIDGRSFDLELALTDEARYQGLSNRESIPDDGGMLFVFARPKVASFVMRECLVPIDIIYLDPGGRIVRMYEMEVEPYDTPEYELTRYSSEYAAQFAIELRGGMIDQLSVQRGQKIDLPLESLKQRAE